MLRGPLRQGAKVLRRAGIIETWRGPGGAVFVLLLLRVAVVAPVEDYHHQLRVAHHGAMLLDQWCSSIFVSLNLKSYKKKNLSGSRDPIIETLKTYLIVFAVQNYFLQTHQESS